MTKRGVILLTRDTVSARQVFHFLSEYHDVRAVIVEEKEPRWTFLRRRIKKLGWTRVMGQVLFQLKIVSLLRWTSQKRIHEIERAAGLNRNAIPGSKVHHVNTINSEKTISILQATPHHAVVVHGTRILGDHLLQHIHTPVLNIHAGITPWYRGVHGMYWALMQNEPTRAGVTVHFVDAGIDTGKIISQCILAPTSKDNFVTYPVMQLAAGLPLLAEAIASDHMGEIQANGKEKGRLWYHPTLWQYLRGRLLKKVK